jgi:hypothetical protein
MDQIGHRQDTSSAAVPYDSHNAFSMGKNLIFPNIFLYSRGAWPNASKYHKIIGWPNQVHPKKNCQNYPINSHYNWIYSIKCIYLMLK